MAHWDVGVRPSYQESNVFGSIRCRHLQAESSTKHGISNIQIMINIKHNIKNKPGSNWRKYWRQLVRTSHTAQILFPTEVQVKCHRATRTFIKRERVVYNLNGLKTYLIELNVFIRLKSCYLIQFLHYIRWLTWCFQIKTSNISVS